jgi:hypothetical protein
MCKIRNLKLQSAISLPLNTCYFNNFFAILFTLIFLSGKNVRSQTYDVLTEKPSVIVKTSIIFINNQNKFNALAAGVELPLGNRFAFDLNTGKLITSSYEYVDWVNRVPLSLSSRGTSYNASMGFKLYFRDIKATSVFYMFTQMTYLNVNYDGVHTPCHKWENYTFPVFGITGWECTESSTNKFHMKYHETNLDMLLGYRTVLFSRIPFEIDAGFDVNINRKESLAEYNQGLIKPPASGSFFGFQTYSSSPVRKSSYLGTLAGIKVGYIIY